MNTQLIKDRETQTAILTKTLLFFTPTVYKGTPAIRAAVSNWQTDLGDLEIAFNEINKALQTFDRKSGLKQPRT